MEPKDNTPGFGGQGGANGDQAPNNNGAGQPAANNGNGDGQGQAPKTFTQDEVNAIVAREKREQNDRVAKFKAAGLSDDQIASLEKKEEIQGSAEELARVRQERVALILDKHKDLVERMDPAYLEKLKNANPEDVETVLSNTLKMVKGIEGDGVPANNGDMPSFESGKPPVGVTPKDQKLVEGISAFERSGDPTMMVQGLIDSWDLKM